MKDKPLYCILYMFVLAAVGSGILLGVDAATRSRVRDNERLRISRTVLDAFGLVDDQTPRQQVLDLFTTRVVAYDAQGRAIDLAAAAEADPIKLGVFEYRLRAAEGDAVVGYGVPIYGQGFWDTIKGVVALAADRRTVEGIAFYEQKETPGLGAEIENPQWRAGFEGKTLAMSGRPLELIAPGETEGPSSVYAVTGATQTSTRLASFMNARLAAWLDHRN